MKALGALQAAIEEVAAYIDTHINPEDVARLSPLGFEHINMLGRYHFDLAESIARGEMRPLRPSSGQGELFW